MAGIYGVISGGWGLGKKDGVQMVSIVLEDLALASRALRGV